jgi:uncharacterized protein (DUF1697 family)
VIRYVAFLESHQRRRAHREDGCAQEVFIRLGFEDVDTFIASGNVLFSSRSKDTAKLERQIGAQLQKDSVTRSRRSSDDG